MSKPPRPSRPPQSPFGSLGALLVWGVVRSVTWLVSVIPPLPWEDREARRAPRRDTQKGRQGLRGEESSPRTERDSKRDALENDQAEYQEISEALAGLEEPTLPQLSPAAEAVIATQDAESHHEHSGEFDQALTSQDERRDLFQQPAQRARRQGSNDPHLQEPLAEDQSQPQHDDLTPLSEESTVDIDPTELRQARRPRGARRVRMRERRKRRRSRDRGETRSDDDLKATQSSEADPSLEDKEGQAQDLESPSTSTPQREARSPRTARRPALRSPTRWDTLGQAELSRWQRYSPSSKRLLFGSWLASLERLVEVQDIAQKDREHFFDMVSTHNELGAMSSIELDAWWFQLNRVDHFITEYQLLKRAEVSPRVRPRLTPHSDVQAPPPLQRPAPVPAVAERAPAERPPDSNTELGSDQALKIESEVQDTQVQETQVQETQVQGSQGERVDREVTHEDHRPNHEETKTARAPHASPPDIVAQTTPNPLIEDVVLRPIGRGRRRRKSRRQFDGTLDETNTGTGTSASRAGTDTEAGTETGTEARMRSHPERRGRRR